MKTIFFLFAVLLATFATAQPKLSKTGWVPVWTETFSPFVTATPFTNDRWSRQMPFGPFFSGTMWTDTNVVLTSRLVPGTSGVNYDATLKCYRNPVPYNVTQAGTRLSRATGTRVCSAHIMMTLSIAAKIIREHCIVGRKLRPIWIKAAGFTGCSRCVAKFRATLVRPQMDVQSLDNMLINNKDNPTFCYYTDGHLREASFGTPPPPAGTLPCNAISITGQDVPILPKQPKK